MESFKQSDVNHDLEAATISERTFDIESSDDDRVQKAIEEAGEDSCGVMGIDVWLLHDDGKLCHFGDGVNWVNPIFRMQLMDNTSAKNEAKLQTLDRLENANNPDYFIPPVAICGVGLAGNFWQQFSGSTRSTKYFHEYLVWRSVESYKVDPDQMPEPRMSALGEVFGKVTGVPFNIDGHTKGIVLYYARANAEEYIINTAVNSSYLRMAAHNIGSSIAMSHARIRRVESRRSQIKKRLAKVKVAFKAVNALNNLISEDKQLQKNSVDTFTNESSELDSIRECAGALKDFCKLLKSCPSFTAKQIRDVKNKTTNPPDINPPPAGNFSTSFWSFISCFFVLLVLFGLHHFVNFVSNEDLGVILPPFGALVTLQFSLTAAPASQPRNSFFGFTVSILVVLVNKLLFHYLADLPQWFYVSLGTSLAIFTMQKLGFIHPPAGAAALVVGMSGKTIKSDVMHGGVLLIADVIAIILAAFFNNLNDHRQYPIYWKMNPFTLHTNKAQLDKDMPSSKKVHLAQAIIQNFPSPKKKRHQNQLSLARKNDIHNYDKEKEEVSNTKVKQ